MTDLLSETLATVPDPEPAPSAAMKKRLGFGAWFCLVWLGAMIVVAIVAPYLGLDEASDFELKGQPPFWDGHLLGGDGLGRDLFNRILLATRASIFVSFSAILIGTLVGGFLGLISGYFKNRAARALGSVFDILLAYPPVVLALTLVSVFATDPSGSGLQREIVVIIALAIVSVPILARITRANTLVWADREFVHAAEAMGASKWRILFREILPNVLPAMLAFALLGVAVAIVAESALSVLAVGLKADTPSWGNIISEGREDLPTSPHIVFSASAFLFLTVLSLNYLGDVIRARFDVKESAL